MFKHKTAFEKCLKCGRTDAVALTDDSNTVWVIWCCCGHVHIYLGMGMDVSITRA